MPDRVLVDTSAWVDFLRGVDSQVAATVDGLLAEDLVGSTGVVRAELLQGCRTEDEFEGLRQLLDATHDMDEPPDVWQSVARLGFDLRRSGHGTAGVPDLLIAITALHHDAPVLTLDADFDAIARVRDLTVI